MKGGKQFVPYRTEKRMRCRNTECCSFIQMKFSHSRQIFNVVCFLSPFILLIVCLFLFCLFVFVLFVLFCFCFVCLAILIAFFHHLCVCVRVCLFCFVLVWFFFWGGGGGWGEGGGLLWFCRLKCCSIIQVKFSYSRQIYVWSHFLTPFILFVCFVLLLVLGFFVWFALGFFVQWGVYEHEVQTIKIFKSH